MKTIYIEMPVSELPDKDGFYYVILNNERNGNNWFKNGKWIDEILNGKETTVKSWLKPITVEELPEVISLKDNLSTAKVCWKAEMTDRMQKDEEIERLQNISIGFCNQLEGMRKDTDMWTVREKSLEQQVNDLRECLQEILDESCSKEFSYETTMLSIKVKAKAALNKTILIHQ